MLVSSTHLPANSISSFLCTIHLYILAAADVEVGYEQTSYTISDIRHPIEMCVGSNLQGVQASFSINITTISEFKTFSLLLRLLYSVYYRCICVMQALQLIFLNQAT